MHILHKTTSLLRRLTTAGFALVVVVAALNVASSKPAAAACSVPAVNYGSATMKLTVGTTGTYRIWTHMNAPDTNNNSYLLEVDGGTCSVVGDSSIVPGTWTWVNHQNGTPSSFITATLSAGVHTLKVIGREPSVKIDRILAVADQNCTPFDTGKNCMATADTTKPVVSIVDPPKNDNISGTVTIKATATDNIGVSKVEFYIQNKLVATKTAAPYEYNWDTTTQANGTYTIDAKAYDAIGNSSTDTIAVGVKNGDVTPPKAPANLTASSSAYNAVSLAWQASTDNVGVTAYRVVRNNSVVATLGNGTTSYKDTSVIANTQYSYYIVAVDAANNVSSASNTVAVTTPKPPTTDTQAPSAPTKPTAAAVSTSQINISWVPSTDNVGVKNYDLYRSQGTATNATKVATLSNTNYGDGGLQPDTTYTYYIVARDVAGNVSQASVKTSATTAKTPTNHAGTSTLRGVVQSSNGRPLAKAKVTIWMNNAHYQATTNYRGRYIMTNIPSGTYIVSYQLTGYDRQTIIVRLGIDKTKWQDVTLHRR